jgi:hypothetical protein
MIDSTKFYKILFFPLKVLYRYFLLPIIRLTITGDVVRLQKERADLIISIKLPPPKKLSNKALKNRTTRRTGELMIIYKDTKAYALTEYELVNLLESSGWIKTYKPDHNYRDFTYYYWNSEKELTPKELDSFIDQEIYDRIGEIGIL